MDPATIMAVGKLGLGAYQAFKANRIKNKRPENRVPAAIRTASSRASQRAALSQRPGRSIADDRINQQTANAVNAMQQSTDNSAEAIQGAAAAQGKEQQAMRQQDQMDMQFMDSANRDYINALSNEGMYEDRNLTRERQDFATDMQSKAALTGSAIQNITGAATGALNNKQYNDYLEDIEGLGGTTTATTATTSSSGNTGGMSINEKAMVMGMSVDDYIKFKKAIGQPVMNMFK